MSAPAVLFAAIASAVSLTADDARLRREYARLELVRYLGKDASSSVVLADAVGTEGLGRRVNVTAASPEVLSDDSVEGVLIPAGATLAATYGRAGTSGERTTIGSTVAAGGSLTVDTATWKRTIAGGENQILAFKTDADFTDFEFSAVDADAVLHGIVRAIPFFVIIR